DRYNGPLSHGIPLGDVQCSQSSPVRRPHAEPGQRSLREDNEHGQQSTRNAVRPEAGFLKLGTSPISSAVRRNVQTPGGSKLAHSKGKLASPRRLPLDLISRAPLVSWKLHGI